MKRKIPLVFIFTLAIIGTALISASTNMVVAKSHISISQIGDIQYHHQMQARTTVAKSATDIWVAGTYNGMNGCPRCSGSILRGIFQHYDGKTWSVSYAPATDGYETIEGLAVLDSTLAYAVGGHALTLLQQPRPSVLKWNGLQWSRVTLPLPDDYRQDGSRLGQLTMIQANSPWDIWVCGTYNAGDREKPLVEHFNGKTWQIVTLPPYFKQVTSLQTVGKTTIATVHDGLKPQVITLVP